MEQYVSKSALVAELEKCIANYKKISVGIDKKGDDWVASMSMLDAKIDALQHILSYINTLEVKEVDLDKEITEYYLHFSIKAIDENNNTIYSDGLTCIKSSDGCSIEVLTDKIKETIEEKYNCVLKSVGIVSLNEISKGLYQILNNKEEHPHFDYYKLDGEEEEEEIGNEENPNLEHDHCSDESNNLVKIKKGCYYLCLKSGTNLSTGRPSFIKGKIYQAPKDDVLVEEDGSLCDVSEGTDCVRLVE